MEIQRAAKLPARHFRRLAGTGARSALNSLLSCNAAICASVNSGGTEFMLVSSTVKLLLFLESSLVSMKKRSRRREKADLVTIRLFRLLTSAATTFGGYN